MQTNTIKHKLKEGGTVLGTCLTDYASPEFVTILKAAAFDFFFIDTEHSPFDYREIQTLVRVSRAADVMPVVRVTQSEYFLIARTLDMGAMGIIAPRIHSVEQGSSVVDAMKFPPLGNRGYGMRNIITDFNFRGAQVEMDSANDETMVILQMESRECVDAIYDITAIPGVDAIMVGPFDLSVSLGIPGDFESPIFWDAFDRMVDACNKNGVAPGVHMGGAGLLKKAQEHGARYLVCGADVSVLLNGLKAIRAEFPVAEAVAAEKSGYM
ncbi:MAG: aldolase/citrate lyase family protein [Acidobacteria bacterium]|nr:aldolase/citrate lyase family protein [Acidobacteriota bacterium]